MDFFDLFVVILILFLTFLIEERLKGTSWYKRLEEKWGKYLVNSIIGKLIVGILCIIFFVVLKVGV